MNVFEVYVRFPYLAFSPYSELKHGFDWQNENLQFDFSQTLRQKNQNHDHTNF